jgi:hypothetical protein
VIVIAKRVGRLANRLLLFAHFIATGMEYGFTVLNPAFGNYARYFPSTARDLLCRFPRPTPFPAFPFGRPVAYGATLLAAGALLALQHCGREVGLIRLRRNQYLDLDGRPFRAFLRRHRTILVQDWFFRSAANCDRHGDAIRAYFTPWEHHRERSRNLVQPARDRRRFLVGVHIRQGDYAAFKNGRFLYSHAQYRDVMQRVEAAFPHDRVIFLVCSDAPIPAEAFTGLDVLYGNGHELEDLYALAACDRLVGPPSTYSKWASFYGRVPRCEIVEPSQSVDPASFRVERALFHEPLTDVTVVDALP